MLGFLSALPVSRGDRELAAAESLALGAALRSARPSAARKRARAADGVLSLAHREIRDATDFIALSVTAGDLVANGRVAKFLVDLRDPAQREVYFVNGNFTRGRRDSGLRQVPLLLRAGRAGYPGRPGGIQPRHLFQPDQAVRGGRGAHLLAGRRERPGLRAAVLSAGRGRERGVVDVVTLVTEKITIPGRQVRVRRHRDAADRRRPSTTNSRPPASRCSPSTGCWASDQLPAAERGRGMGLPADLPGRRRCADPGGHPGVRRTAARPVGGGRSHHQGGAGQQLPRQPQVQGTRHAEHGAAGRRAGQSRGWRRGRPAGALRGAAPTISCWKPRPTKRWPAASPSGTTSRGSRWSGSRRRSCAPTTRSAPGRRRTRWRSPGSTAARPRTSGSWRTAGCWAGWRTPGRPAAGSATTWCPTGSGCRCRSTATWSTIRPTRALQGGTRTPSSQRRRPAPCPARERARRVYGVQTCFLNATIPPDDLAAVKAKLDEVLPGVKKIKIRSSANAEDVPELRRRRPARQFRRHREQAGQSRRLLRFRGRRRAGRGGQAEGLAEVGGLRDQGRLRQPVEPAGGRGTHVRPHRPRHGGDGTVRRRGLRRRVRRQRQRRDRHQGAQHPGRLRLHAVRAGGQQPGDQPRSREPRPR